MSLAFIPAVGWCTVVLTGERVLIAEWWRGLPARCGLVLPVLTLLQAWVGSISPCPAWFMISHPCFVMNGGVWDMLPG